jgi:hypothetical protein
MYAALDKVLAGKSPTYVKKNWEINGKNSPNRFVKKSSELSVRGAHSFSDQRSVKSCLIFIGCCDLQ